MKKYLIISTAILSLIFVAQAFCQVKLPPITEKTLANGIELVVVENHELPVISMRIVLKTGAAYDPKGKAGLANLTAGLLRKGTKKLKATEIAEKIDFVGGSLGASANRDASNITCSVLVKHFQVGLDLLSDIILNPALDSSEFNRDRSRAIAGVKQSKDDPSTVCEEGFNRALFGDHPYGQPDEGTEASLTALSVDDVRKFYNEYYKPNNAIVLVAGDVKPAQIIKAVEKSLGSWKKGVIPELKAIEPKNPVGYSVSLIDKEDATQAYIRFGHLGITRKAPDYYPVLLMNYILGVSFTSRLNQVVRVDKGLTYDIRTQNEWNVMPAAYFCNTFTENDSTMTAINAAIDVIKSMQTGEVSDVEFNEAKNFYTGYYPMTMETPDQVAAEIVKVKLYGLPVSYIKDFTANVNKVTKAEILKAAQTHWHPSDMTFCVVTKAADVEEKLKALGPVTKISIDQF